MVTLSALLPSETDAVARKSQPNRKRARDDGAVVPLGVEVQASIYDALDRCRAAKKWSKRTLVEEALRCYLASEGYSPAASEAD